MDAETTVMFTELVGFLDSCRPDVRAMALEGVVGYSENSQFLCFATGQGEQGDKQRLVRPIMTVRALLKFLGSDMSEQAMTALVNLSVNDDICDAMLKCKACSRLVDNLRDQSRGDAPDHAGVNIMLLSNLTRRPEGVVALIGPAELDSLFLERLWQLWLIRDEKWAAISDVLRNVSATVAGRDALRRLEPPALPQLVKQLKECTTRRTACLTTCLHLALDESFCQNFLDDDVLPRLLALQYPPDQRRLLAAKPGDHQLMGGKAQSVASLTEARAVHSTVEHESSGPLGPQVQRETLLSIVKNVLSTSVGREYCRKMHAYEVLRVWHLTESEESIRAVRVF
ncbi:MAG: hypothetical protein KVP17_004873 [Porospora cf. gigantea B]|uniref:uncharacterized protein n=1 Tax=Porospora cf. gigantea B TaxID=2853592 RepID=UPI00357199CF|nr:MAG: hypothetical protein KVP17_004873 [Porospora cf. gigantea B]